jgi:glucokinase|tara:strand:+ start:1016 stop:1966 length:951 start_codon:yes stop_codon:yes gene_type:complete
MSKEYVIGIDVGGTHTRIGKINAKGEVLKNRMLKTAEYGDGATFLEDMIEVIKSMVDGPMDYFLGIGIGAPSVNEDHQTITYASNLNWEGSLDIVGVLGEVFSVPVQLTNDANLLVLAHQYFDDALLSDFFVVTLGTGVGAGICCNGSLLKGKEGFAGELGHVIVKDSGRSCSCGRKGCLETYVSAKGMIRTVTSLIAEFNSYKGSLLDLPISDLNAKMITELAGSGDEIAKKALTLTGQILGKALANMVALFNPEHIYLAGGLTHAGQLLLIPTCQSFEEHLLNVYPDKILIENSKFKDDEGAILGASALIWQLN